MLRVTCLAMLCALHAHALASPRSDPTQGRAVFTGASTPSATSIEINPAALGLGNADEIYVAGTAVLDRLSITRRTLDIDTGTLADGAHVSGNLVSPGGMIAGIWHSGVSGRITLGVALHSSPAERFLHDEEALRYHTLGGSYRTYAGSVASSIRFAGGFYFGLSLAIHTSFLELRYARDSALAAGRDPARGIASDCGGAPCGIENPAATERYDVSARTDLVALENVVATLGIAVRLAKDVWLGASYHAPPGLAIQNELSGSMKVVRAPRDGGGTLTGGATVYLSQPASADVEARARLAGDLELHVGTRWEDLSRLQYFDVRGYGSVFPGNGVPEWQPRTRGFHDSLAVWAGIEQIERGFPLIFGGRVGYETASLPHDRTSAMTIAPASGTLDLGVQYRITRDLLDRPQWIVQLSYGLQYFPTVDVEDSAFDPRDQLRCYDSGYDYSTPACAAVRAGYALPTAAGEYSRFEQAMRIAVRLAW